MIQACQQAEVVLNINENWRWRPWFRMIKQMIAEGKIGRPVYARFFAHGPSWLPGIKREDHRFRRWKRVILYDWGIHHIDVLRFLFGEADSVYARLAGLNPELIGDDRAIVMLAFGDLTGLVDLSWSSYAPWGRVNRKDHNVEDVRIEGDAGTIALVPDLVKGDLIRLTTVEGEWEQPAYDCEPLEAYERSYVTTQGHFIECLLDGVTPETHALDNYETLAITLAAYHSAESNQVIKIAEYKQKAENEL
jgi:predicted dehydrogenase